MLKEIVHVVITVFSRFKILVFHIKPIHHVS
jgi:hypothetical protein